MEQDSTCVEKLQSSICQNKGEKQNLLKADMENIVM